MPLLGILRGLHMAASFAAMGTMLMAAWLLAPAPPALRLAVRRLAWGAVLAALLTGLAWFLLQAANMAGAQSVADLRAALPTVAAQTRFGTLLIGRCAALLLAGLALRAGAARLAALLAGGAVGAEAWLGHGGAMGGPVGALLLASACIHLLAGGAWLGALPALRLGIGRLEPREAARLARRFSPLGMVCVAAIAGSATVQSVVLIGSLRAFATTGYGAVALAKIALLIGLVGFAALNRARLVPALGENGGENGAARRRLLASIGAEIALGMAVLLAAGLLLTLAPPTMAAMLNGAGQ